MILELGAGSGALSCRLVDQGFGVAASDLTGESFCGKAEFSAADLNGDFSRVFRGRRYDAVVALEVTEHFENPLHFLREAARLLERDAVLWLSFPNIYVYSAVRAFVSRGEFASWSAAQCWDTGHQTILTDWLLEQHCEKCGMVVEKKGFCALVDLRRQYTRIAKGLLARVYLDAAYQLLGLPTEKTLLWDPSRTE